jgi:dethiobiotin synthetase
MRIVVCGVGTDVGKTWTCVALTLWLRNRGTRCIALKPVESGGDADSRALEQASGFHVEPPPYRFEQPIGPHLAAQRASVTIDLQTCVHWVERCSDGYEVTIVEMAGGLFSPLSNQHTNADLLKKLAADAWIAVAVDKLGVLHELKALLIAAEALALGRPVVVLNAPLIPDASTGTNGAQLESLGTCQVGASFSRGQPDEPPAKAEVGRLAAALGLA